MTNHTEQQQPVVQTKSKLKPNFAVGSWFHLFGPGAKETRCEIAIDISGERLAAAREWTGLKWEPILGDRLKDLQESVIEVNEAHVLPDEWEIERVAELPDWAEGTTIDRANPPSNTVAGIDLNALEVIIGCASRYIEDIETGIEDGTYLASENENLPALQQAFQAVSEWYSANGKEAVASVAVRSDTSEDDTGCIRDLKCSASLDSGLLTLENGKVIDLEAVGKFLLETARQKIPETNDAEHELLVEVIDDASAVLNASGLLPFKEATGQESSAEVLPGATREEIGSVMMQDLVGSYDTPDQVPEWAWVEREASFSHKENGKQGVWEFVINLSRHFDDVPEKLQATITKARNEGLSYLIFDQGT